MVYMMGNINREDLSLTLKMLWRKSVVFFSNLLGLIGTSGSQGSLQ